MNAVAAVGTAESDILLLVKPQFEVGRTAVRGGLVTDPATRADAVASANAAYDRSLLGAIKSLDLNVSTAIQFFKQRHTRSLINMHTRHRSRAVVIWS